MQRVNRVPTAMRWDIEEDSWRCVERMDADRDGEELGKSCWGAFHIPASASPIGMPQKHPLTRDGAIDVESAEIATSQLVNTRLRCSNQSDF